MYILAAKFWIALRLILHQTSESNHKLGEARNEEGG